MSETGADPFLGTMFAGRFVIERELASGGMGAVYVAVQHPVGRRVALKVIKGAGGAAPDLVLRFQREIGVLASLNHPNVVTMFDCGVDNGNLFLVMELMTGRSLREEIKALAELGQPRMPWGRALRIGHHVARALAAVHEGGVVHRDLKPENIFMTTSVGHRDFAKLLDFGIVRHESQETQRLTQTGGIVGTPGYLSPEQLHGLPASPKSDVYALGVILYELTTGVFPFEAPTVQAMALRQLVEVTPPPKHHATDLSDDVNDLIVALMSREPDLRPSIAIVLQRLEEQLHETSGPVPSGALIADAGAPAKTPRRETLATDAAAVFVSPPPTPAAPHRRRLLVASVGAGVLLSLVAIASLVSSFAADDPPASVAALPAAPPAAASPADPVAAPVSPAKAAGPSPSSLKRPSATAVASQTKPAMPKTKPTPTPKAPTPTTKPTPSTKATTVKPEWIN